MPDTTILLVALFGLFMFTAVPGYTCYPIDPVCQKNKS